MIAHELTGFALAARRLFSMREAALDKVVGHGLRAIGAVAMLSMGSGMAGCINVDVPSEPIVIELNINVTQQVLFALTEDADDALEENADIF